MRGTVIGVMLPFAPKGGHTMTAKEKEIRRTIVLERAHKIMDVLAQAPLLEDNKAREAANAVYSYCRQATVLSPEDEEAWESVFRHVFPLPKDDATAFLNLFSKPSTKV